MTVEALISALHGVRRTGKGRYLCKCPAHKDRRASLSIRELADGRVLCHCFAGCDVEAVLAAVGLTFEALFPQQTINGGRPREVLPFSARELVSALSNELHVVWLILADVASGREIVTKDRQRAAVASKRCIALLDELRIVR